MRRAIPMLRVYDVQETIDWYSAVGFELESTHEDCGEIDWAKMTFGTSIVMFNAGGHRSQKVRRETDLYLVTEGVDELYEKLSGHGEVVIELYESFYGMREFGLRDPSGYWVTFAEPVTKPAD